MNPSHKVKEISFTTTLLSDNGQSLTPEQLMVYTARVSSPGNQDQHDTGARLLKYCIANGHWSVFEMVDWTVEIITSRAIAQQILRHRSFSFQEFSQRYQDVTKLGEVTQAIELRAKAKGGNRQGSVPLEESEVGPNTAFEATRLAEEAIRQAVDAYGKLCTIGIAPETARMVLPLCTTSKLYMKGSCRSWIHYFEVRCDGHAQKEHRLIAEDIRSLFNLRFPILAEALAQS